MTEPAHPGPEHTQARSVGETGGLPGANADPATARLSEDELADTVNSGEPVQGRSADQEIGGEAADDGSGAATNG